jgi:hypothetical protein
MLYIFKDSLGRNLICGEVEAREIIDNKGGSRIKYEYIGSSDGKDYNKALTKIKGTILKKEDLLNDEYILKIRKEHEDTIKEAEEGLIKVADKSVLPREFKVYNLGLGEGSLDNKTENKDPRFKRMIK